MSRNTYRQGRHLYRFDHFGGRHRVRGLSAFFARLWLALRGL